MLVEARMKAYRTFVLASVERFERQLKLGFLLPVGTILPLAVLMSGGGLARAFLYLLAVVALYVSVVIFWGMMSSVAYLVQPTIVSIIKRRDPRWPHSRIPVRTRDLLDTAIPSPGGSERQRSEER
jgi:hypothetical protein